MTTKPSTMVSDEKVEASRQKVARGRRLRGERWRMNTKSNILWKVAVRATKC